MLLSPVIVVLVPPPDSPDGVNRLGTIEMRTTATGTFPSHHFFR